MRDTLRMSADRLRLQAIIVSTACLLAASALPAVSYGFVFQHASMTLGPFAWAHWIVVGVACTLGVLAHGMGNNVLLALHAVVCCMLGAALGGFDTAFWLQLDTRCATRQSAFMGCEGCGCAIANTCTAATLATDPTCLSCTAYPRDVCGPALEQANKFVMAFTGLAAVLLLAVPAFYSLLVLCRMESSSGVAAAKRQMVCFAVDQQTALVESGEKPSVTPAMLAAWVSFLLDCAEADCASIGEKCRVALAARGFELPVMRKKGSSLKAKRHKRGGARQVSADAPSGSEAGPSVPAADVYVAAESGSFTSKAARGAQVAAEEQQNGQWRT